MSTEDREKLELKVSWAEGCGVIQCEASRTPSAMKTTVQKLAAAFTAAWPPARAAWEAQAMEFRPALGVNQAKEYDEMIEALLPLCQRGESFLGTLLRVLKEHGSMPGREPEESRETLGDYGLRLARQTHDLLDQVGAPKTGVFGPLTPFARIEALAKDRDEALTGSAPYASAYNRAITDAHNAMADEFGHASQDPNGIRAQAAIRRLYKPLAESAKSDVSDAHPPEDVAPHDREVHVVLDSTGVPSTGIDGRTLSVRERIRLLEKQCSDALDEYASFRVMAGEPKTLPERIRLLGDSWRRLEDEQRRIRAEVAERLWWALGPSGGQAKKHDLDAMLAEVVRANEDALKWRNREVTATSIRDAAMEEAAGEADFVVGTAFNDPIRVSARALADRIRALKAKRPEPKWLSVDEVENRERNEDAARILKDHGFGDVLVSVTDAKPAPDAALSPVIVTDTLCVDAVPASTPPLCLTPGCEKPTGHAPPCEPCGAKPVPQPSGNSGELTPEQIRELKEFRESRAAERKVDPNVHDFGWALHQMRAGRKVRRVNESSIIAFTPDGFHFGGNEILLSKGDLLATDWQVVG